MPHTFSDFYRHFYLISCLCSSISATSHLCFVFMFPLHALLSILPPSFPPASLCKSVSFLLFCLQLNASAFYPMISILVVQWAGSLSMRPLVKALTMPNHTSNQTGFSHKGLIAAVLSSVEAERQQQNLFGL